MYATQGLCRNSTQSLEVLPTGSLPGLLRFQNDVDSFLADACEDCGLMFVAAFTRSLPV